jgi:hypothetical protein
VPQPGLETDSRARTVDAWLVPDVALVASFVALFYCLFLFEGYRKLFRDSDSGWHIRTGEAMLTTLSLPRTDPYSFSAPGRPWVAWEWGADLLTGAAHRAAGLGGVAFLFSLAIAAGVWMWFRLNWAAGGAFLGACLLAIPMLSTSNLHWLARPHVLGWLFLLGAVWAAESAPARWRLPHAAAVGAAMALWTNLHASFFFGPVIFAIYAVSDSARRSWFVPAAAVAAAATLVNPYGWNLHRHIAAYLSDTELISRIGEFQSFNFHAGGAAQILFAVLISMASVGLMAAQGRWAQAVLVTLLAAVALRSARGLPVLALAALPLANGAISRALAQSSSRRIHAALDHSQRLRSLDRAFHGLALAPVFALLMFLLLKTPGIAARTGFPPDDFPVAASAEVAKLPLSARILAPDKFGGYLIYRFAGVRKVYFDGRSDLYGADFMKEYARLMQVRPGWEAALGKYGFTHALLPVDYSLIPALEARGWKTLYRDGVAVLMERG